MWLAIWGCFAIFVLVFVGWTIGILMQQKKTWSAFAKKHGLRYQPGKFMDSPSVAGELKGRKFSLSPGIQQTDDIRGQRFVTVIEFQLGRGMPTGAAIATQEFAGFIEGLIFDKRMRPKLPEWKKQWIVKTRMRKSLEAYFTPERQQIICRLFSMKNTAGLFFFDELEAVLRLEMSDPLRDPAQMERIVGRLIADVDKLAPTAEEKKAFRTMFLEEKKMREAGIDEEDEVEDPFADVAAAEEAAAAHSPETKPEDKKPDAPDQSGA